MNRANHFHRLASGKEKGMSVTSGHMSGQQFATYDRDSRSWRTWPDTGLWGSIEYSGTWPKTGRMCGGQASELPTPARRTTGKESLFSSFLPTPTASDGKRNDSAGDQKRRSPGITTVSTHWPGLVE